jgi:hypothetical protein
MFRNDPLPVVLNKLSMIFNVDIELQGEELKNYRYRALSRKNRWKRY